MAFGAVAATGCVRAAWQASLMQCHPWQVQGALCRWMARFRLPDAYMLQTACFAPVLFAGAVAAAVGCFSARSPLWSLMAQAAVMLRQPWHSTNGWRVRTCKCVWGCAWFSRRLCAAEAS